MPKALLLLLLLPLLAEEETPTPAQRIAALRREQAAQRVKLAALAARWKLGTDAEIHYRAARALDPENRTAKARLAGRRSFRDGKGARDRHGEELRRREIERLRAEAAAFGALGRALKAEGHGEAAAPLLLRAHILDPRDEATARALGLVPIRRGFGTGEEAALLRAAPPPESAGDSGFLAARLGVSTKAMAAGSVTAEAEGDAPALGTLARLGDQAQRLTALRFGTAVRGTGWITLVVARGKPQFDRFLDSLSLRDPWLTNMKKLGSARIFRPRHCLASFVAPLGDPRNRAGLFLHEIPENLLFLEAPQRVPAWLHEAVGIDTCLTLLGQAGTLCVTYESSTGLREKDALADPLGWPALLLRRSAAGDLPKFENLVMAQIQALGPEDLVAAHAYYRFLLLTRRGKLPAYLRRVRTEEDRVTAFTEAFELAPEDLTRDLTRLLLGTP